MQRPTCTNSRSCEEIQEECCARTETEIGVRHLQAKEHQRLQETWEAGREAWNSSPRQPSEAAWPCCHLDFEFLGSRMMKEYISIVLSLSVCGMLPQQFWATNTLTLNFSSSLIFPPQWTTPASLSFSYPLLTTLSAQPSGSFSRIFPEPSSLLCSLASLELVLCVLHNCSLELCCLVCAHLSSSTGLKFLEYRNCILFSS